ncbi:hypothetical protein [Acinetobacter sp. CAAS 2-6]|uniref:hypothetical protein n=1 Tax=Acinetobacter sp. CAAS 2-6 TaxID=3016358 RepID=UPI002DD62170|nr:hypothetical protein [Acinetobacter sp. CAAS 2-6]
MALPKKIIGSAYDFYQSDQDSLCLIDSPYTHVEYWEVLKSNSPELQNLQYEEIPRRRVIYNARLNKPFVYMDAKLLKTNIAK